MITNRKKGCAKLFIKFSQKELRWVTELYTGHRPIRFHLNQMCLTVRANIQTVCSSHPVISVHHHIMTVNPLPLVNNTIIETIWELTELGHVIKNVCKSLTPFFSIFNIIVLLLFDDSISLIVIFPFPMNLLNYLFSKNKIIL